MSKDYTIVCAGASDDEMYFDSDDANLVKCYPALVYDSKTMSFLGYLPYQATIFAHIYSVGENSYFLTGFFNSLCATKIGSNVVQDLESELKSESQVKAELFHTTDVVEDVCFDGHLVALHEKETIHVFDLSMSNISTGSKLNEIHCVAKLKTSKFHPGEEYASNFLDKDLGIVILCQRLATVEVWKFTKDPETSILFDFRSDLFPKIEFKEDEDPSYCVEFLSGLLILRSSYGWLRSYKWDGEGFVPHQRHFDDCFEIFHNANHCIFLTCTQYSIDQLESTKLAEFCGLMEEEG
jgi:hypothetical protein